MGKIKISIKDSEVVYRDTSVPFKLLKKEILKTHGEFALKYQLTKHFDKTTGEIHRKYAWDNIFHTLKATGELINILNKLINE